MINNWMNRNLKDGRRLWQHTHNPRLGVSIVKIDNKYWISYNNPTLGGNGKTEIEYTAKGAKKKADMYLKHWNDPAHWSSNPPNTETTPKPIGRFGAKKRVTRSRK